MVKQGVVECGVSRPIWVEIHLQNLTENFLTLSRLISPQVSLLSVVKANAYGHGLLSISKTLADLGSNYFGVSSIEEGSALRCAGIKNPILVLGSIYPFQALEEAIHKKIHVTIASLEAAKICKKFAEKMQKKIFAHAKVDTGMNRIGVQVEKGVEFVREIKNSPSIALDGVYTHFSGSAEDPQFTKKQLELFSNLVSALKKEGIKMHSGYGIPHGYVIPYFHCANSAALLKYPESHFSMVRPGIALYGVNPVKSSSPGSRHLSVGYDLRGEGAGEGKNFELTPVLSWKSRIVFLKEVPAGTPVSYAGTFRTKRKSKIATAAFGYADGYQRTLSNKGWVLVRGRRVPVIGRVTMDMTMLDVTDLPEVGVGDEVVLIGGQGREQISVEEVADWAETSPYEIFCGIASRVPRVDIR